MPRVAVEDNKRMNLRVQPDQKATLLRAAALRNTDLTDFVLQQALREARAVIEEAERVVLTRRDSLRVLDMLEHPPAPTPSSAKQSQRCRSGDDSSRLARRSNLKKARSQVLRLRRARAQRIPAEVRAPEPRGGRC